MSDAVQMLEEQHVEATALFMKLERLTDPVAISHTFRLLDGRLRDHTAIEEQIFYPAFRKRAGSREDSGREVDDAIHDHAQVKAALSTLERMDPDGSAFKARLSSLRSMVDEHVREERRLLFPQARAIFSKEELDDLAFRMARAATLHSSVYEMA